MQIPDSSLKVTVQCTQSAFLSGFLRTSSGFVARFMLLNNFIRLAIYINIWCYTVCLGVRRSRVVKNLLG